MTVRPILFSGSMVRALLAGTKTQTRRLVKEPVPAPPEMDNLAHAASHQAPYLDAYCSEPRTPQNPRGMGPWWCWWTRDDRPCEQFRVGYAPGDLLWVRETWAWWQNGEGLCGIDYRATPKCNVIDRGWKPAIHMPRAHSRLTLAVTDVRVERLQEISETDAWAEGVCHFVEDREPPDSWHGRSNTERHAFVRADFGSARGAYKGLWDMINDRPGRRWADNPWIVAITSSVHPHNVDAYLAQHATEAA